MCVNFIYTKNNKYVYVFIHTSSPWQIFPIACPFVVTRHQNMHICIQHTRIGFNDTRRGGYCWLVRMFGVSCRCLSALQLAYLFACNRAPRLVAALASERWGALEQTQHTCRVFRWPRASGRFEWVVRADKFMQTRQRPASTTGKRSERSVGESSIAQLIANCVSGTEVVASSWIARGQRAVCVVLSRVVISL